MGECLILCGDQQSVFDDLAVINMVAASWHEAQGYTVIDMELVPRNEETGLDDLEAPRTKTWDVPKESANGQWYIVSPANDEKFNKWRDYIGEYQVKCEEIEIPEEWKPQGD